MLHVSRMIRRPAVPATIARLAKITKITKIAMLAMLGALLLPAAPVVSAQCFGPDNLDLGPCCAATLPNLPVFPGASLPGLGICWGQCTVNNQRTLKVAWTPPAQPFCAEYTTTLTVFDGSSGLPLLGGQLTLDYTRTWDEITTTGTVAQVWRFTAKADLVSLAAPGGPPCPVPNCIAPVGPHPTAFFYGYVDYTNCTAAGTWENVLVLYHACDRFIHAPGLSDRPGVFHASSSFAIVAPHSALQPFVPVNVVAPGGNVFAEATRSVTTSGLPPFACTVEDPVAFGSMTPLGAGCVCTLSISPKQQTLRQFTGQTQCTTTAGTPGAWTSLNINFPTLPWLHMVSTSIGRWTNPNMYPSTESVWVDEGLFVHQDACTGSFLEQKYGASTRNGWTVLSIPGSPTNFTDLVDNYTAPLAGPFPTPIMGSVRPTDHLIYVNEP